MMEVIAITFFPQYKQQCLTENKNAIVNCLEEC